MWTTELGIKFRGEIKANRREGKRKECIVKVRRGKKCIMRKRRVDAVHEVIL